MYSGKLEGRMYIRSHANCRVRCTQANWRVRCTLDQMYTRSQANWRVRCTLGHRQTGGSDVDLRQTGGSDVH